MRLVEQMRAEGVSPPQRDVLPAEVNSVAESRKDAVTRVGISSVGVSDNVVTVELVLVAEGVIDSHRALVLGERQRRGLYEVLRRPGPVGRGEGIE